MYDAIVVGARCAGAATAMLLARNGHRVLLVDRGHFPSDMRLSTHLVWQPGIARLDRWGLREQLAGSGCPAITGGAIDFGAFTLTGSIPPAGDVREAYAPRRFVLDTLLVEAAARAEAEILEGCTVDGLVTGDPVDGAGPRVHGVRGRIGGGRFTATARVVIGADGMRSAVARMTQAPSYLDRPALQGTYFSYWSGLSLDQSTLHVRPYRTVTANPTHDGLTVVAVSWPVDEYLRARADIAGFFDRTVETVAPGLADRLRAGRREERWSGATVSSFFRRRSARAGHWWGTPATRRTPARGRGSPTPSRRPISSPRPSTTRSAAAAAGPRRCATTSGSATRPPCRCTSSPTSSRRCSHRPR